MTKKTTVTTTKTIDTSTRPAIRIIRASSREQQDLLPAKLREFENESSVVLCARGGYGASDVLPLLPWDQLRKNAATPKLLIGFSDTSALHSALWRQLGWVGLHGPMPATTLWPEGAIENRQISPDIGHLLELVSGQALGGGITLQGVAPHPGGQGAPTSRVLEGWLFGGCFSVLTNLIGTPYLPESFEGAILFFEDIGEHPARLARFVNQWEQAGLLRGVRAIVWGSLTQLGQNIPDCAPCVYSELTRRVGGIPTFHSSEFGHVAPNWPLGIGTRARIARTTDGTTRLEWSFANVKKGAHS